MKLYFSERFCSVQADIFMHKNIDIYPSILSGELHKMMVANSPTSLSMVLFLLKVY